MAPTTDEVPLSSYILTQILQHLSPEPEFLPFGRNFLPEGERRVRQQALARLALVSRTVSAYALDTLWSHIDDLRDLLSVFPAYDRQSTQQRFRDTITDEDWARFQTYAVRIRSLHLGDVSGIHAHVWTILTRLSPRDPLLPNLERLSGFAVDELSVCYTVLLSPTIREFYLQVKKETDAGTVRMVMQAARSTLSGVRQLTIDDDINVSYNGVPARPPAVQFWTLTQLQALLVVQEVSLTAEQLRSLAAIPGLQTLRLSLKSMPELGTPLPAGASFAQLRDLSLSGALQHVGEFVATASPPLLESLTVSSHLKCTELASIRRAKEAIVSLPALLPATTRKVHLLMTCGCHSNEKLHFPDAAELLEPYRGLTALREIHFHFVMKFHLPDKVLHSLGDAWPDLRVFTVVTYAKPSPPPARHSYDYGYMRAPIYAQVPYRYSRSPSPEQPVRTDDPPTLPTLAAFAFAHPQLATLALPALDLTPPEPDTIPLLNHALRTLRISALPASTPLFASALVLDVLFPSLDLRDAQAAVLTGPGGACGDRMNELALILLGLQAGRTGTHWARAVGVGGYKGEIPLPPHARRRAQGQGVSPPSRPPPAQAVQRPRQSPPGSTIVVIPPAPNVIPVTCPSPLRSVSSFSPTPPQSPSPSLRPRYEYYERAPPFGT
ncbi:hypothetical protein PYCCODRAFT_1480641 [Trametes coccinea BRFM310]|uniref:Uncharacterized protein n=1 Tax=Trametes coccinea (strain BRFM310) TaxID=1353009 RepID=A0A1Y2IBI6_TRAC3|nr:hypothetical protein PYCCODRAFT_1480641 [Trametes coccinea BRFM310]